MKEKEEMKRVVFYVRESTDNLPQQEALKKQVQWCYELSEKQPDWVMVHEPFVDEGLSGTSAETRESFQEMIRFAENGGCDLIVTREVSRFARNTLDTIRYVRRLKEHGVYVKFIHENIDSQTTDGEIMLTIMASIAQDESRKISKRVLAGQKTSMQRGVIFGNGNILGYDKTENGYIVNENQAEIVRKIFNLYLEGSRLTKIKHELETEGYVTSKGNNIWDVTTISKILKNISYTGSSVYRKSVTKDYLTHKRTPNKEEETYIFVPDTHPAIISKEDYLAVQEKLAEKRPSKDPVSRSGTDVWTKLLVCGCCGKKFIRESGQKRAEMLTGYICRNKKSQGTARSSDDKALPINNRCNSMRVTQWVLYLIVEQVFQKIEKAQPVQTIHEPDPDAAKNDENIKFIDSQLEKIILLRADGEISLEDFRRKKEELLMEKDRRAAELLRSENKTEIAAAERIDNNAIKSMIKKIVVYEDRFEVVTGNALPFRTKEFTVTKKEAKDFISKHPELKIVNNWKNKKIRIVFSEED